MYHGNTHGEVTACRKLVRLCLAKGYTLSVHDGEEWACKLATTLTPVIDALGNTDMDTLRLRDSEGAKVGDFQLVWGNDPEELVSDYSATDVLDTIWREWQASL